MLVAGYNQLIDAGEYTCRTRARTHLCVFSQRKRVSTPGPVLYARMTFFWPFPQGIWSRLLGSCTIVVIVVLAAEARALIHWLHMASESDTH